jgi:hypothetical protein
MLTVVTSVPLKLSEQVLELPCSVREMFAAFLLPESVPPCEKLSFHVPLSDVVFCTKVTVNWLDRDAANPFHVPLMSSFAGDVGPPHAALKSVAAMIPTTNADRM